MLKSKQSYVLLFLFAAAFVLITFKGLKTAQPGDENVYYYMGKLVSEGKIPYKDFFLAHPPLQIYMIASVYKIFGFSIIALKLIPLLSTLITAFCIFKIAQKFGNMEAITASLLFLSSYSVMFNSVFSFGIDVAAMLLIAGVYFSFNRGYYLLSGLFFGLAAITRLLALVPIAVILLYFLFSGKKAFFKLSLSFLMIFLLANGAFFLASDSYFSNVYGYHLQKTFGGKENFREYFDILKLNWILFFSALLFIFANARRQLALFACVSLPYLLFLMSLKKIFGFYFLIAFPFLAIIGAYSAVNLAGIIPKKLKIIAFGAFTLIFIWNLSSDVIFLEKIGFTGFERGRDLAEFIVLNSDGGAMLFGDDSVTPLLALQTNRRIALDFVDTNDQVFISGVKNLNVLLEDLKGKSLLFIARDKQGISYFKEVREFLGKNCEFLSQFHDKMEGNYLVYRCK
ncbi:glycosyltransferase family 39 protein [Candidatus Woesearchaeota archaeon]|nr:glycosyltransferase family 39 protein [Candidatus Woesearchaeota archaeon]